MILSYLLSDSNVNIDSMEDLVVFVEASKDKSNICIGALEQKLTWQLLINSEDENF